MYAGPEPEMLVDMYYNTRGEFLWEGEDVHALRWNNWKLRLKSPRWLPCSC